jgi:hypothetical protein
MLRYWDGKAWTGQTLMASDVPKPIGNAKKSQQARQHKKPDAGASHSADAVEARRPRRALIVIGVAVGMAAVAIASYAMRDYGSDIDPAADLYGTWNDGTIINPSITSEDGGTCHNFLGFIEERCEIRAVGDGRFSLTLHQNDAAIADREFRIRPIGPNKIGVTLVDMNEPEEVWTRVAKWAPPSASAESVAAANSESSPRGFTMTLHESGPSTFNSQFDARAALKPFPSTPTSTRDNGEVDVYASKLWVRFGSEVDIPKELTGPTEFSETVRILYPATSDLCKEEAAALTSSTDVEGNYCGIWADTTGSVILARNGVKSGILDVTIKNSHSKDWPQIYKNDYPGVVGVRESWRRDVSHAAGFAIELPVFAAHPPCPHLRGTFFSKGVENACGDKDLRH